LDTKTEEKAEANLHEAIETRRIAKFELDIFKKKCGCNTGYQYPRLMVSWWFHVCGFV
jgi:hypothetical protein